MQARALAATPGSLVVEATVQEGKDIREWRLCNCWSTRLPDVAQLRNLEDCMDV